MHLIRRRSLLQGIRRPLNQPQPLWRRRRGMNLVLGQLRAGMREDEVWGPARARPANAHAMRGSPRTGKHGPLVCTRASGPRARCRFGGLRGKCAIGERSFWRRSCSGDSAMKHPGLAKSGDTFLFVLLFHPSISLSLPFLNSLFLTGFIFISMLIHPFSLAVYASSANESHLSAGSRVPARRSASAMPSRGTSCWWA